MALKVVQFGVVQIFPGLQTNGSQMHVVEVVFRGITLRILEDLFLSQILCLTVWEKSTDRSSACLLIRSEDFLEMVNKCSTMLPTQCKPIWNNQIIRFPWFKETVFLFSFLIVSLAVYLLYNRQQKGNLNNNTTLHVNGAFHPSISKIPVNIIQLNINFKYHFKAKKMGAMQVADLPKVTH